MNFIQEIQKTIARAKETEGLKDLAVKVEAAVGHLGETAMHMGTTALSPGFKVAFAHAYPFLEVVGDVVMSWMLLWRAVAAAPHLEKLLGSAQAEERNAKIEKNKNTAFYDGQLKTAEYFIDSVLPATIGKMKAIRVNSKATMEIHANSFGGL